MSKFTTSVVPVCPGTTTPLRYQVMVVPGVGVTLAVIVAVWNGLSMVADVAILMVGCALTVTVTLAQVVVLQVPSALTKKVVVVFTFIPVNVAPVPTKVPPQLPLYHLQVAPVPRLPPVTFKVTVPGPHSVVALAVAPVAAVDSELMVMVVVATTAGHPPPAANV